MEERIIFYNQIVSISDQTRKIDKIADNVNDIVSIITEGYKENALISANNSHNKSYIFIYNTKALFKNELLNDYLFLSPEMTNIYKSRKLLDVPRKLIDVLYPFQVIYETYDHNDDKYVCICIKW